MSKRSNNAECDALIVAGDCAENLPERQPGTAFTDRAIIDAALSGDTTAWEALYDQCHPPLLNAARAVLGGRNADPNQIDELAARVWYALVRNCGELLARFDPSRGCRLTTFLGSLARDHAIRMFRSERRRRRREAISCDLGMRNGVSTVPAVDGASIEMAEFENTLTPKEREFYREIVVDNGQAESPVVVQQPARSDANRWQLRLRVRRKLEAFLTR